ncbi:hypothetical protein DPEC_G00174390 [Dallia pectoralis]|uniref:Uncharacterized protein n=1 Tax=Dallia pectoralis TaxID=75939 RepID=A0ACC2GEE0_DALPE|nr:hypothetical protein DPEC_G00174390 [Dallia pectoralis]
MRQARVDTARLFSRLQKSRPPPPVGFVSPGFSETDGERGVTASSGILPSFMEHNEEGGNFSHLTIQLTFCLNFMTCPRDNMAARITGDEKNRKSCVEPRLIHVYSEQAYGIVAVWMIRGRETTGVL